MPALRLAKLQKLRDMTFGGSAAQLAKAVNRSGSQISQWFTGVRTITEDSARRIEKSLKLPAGWMDQPLDDETDGHKVRPGNRIPVVGSARLGDNGTFVELEYPVGHGDGHINLPSDDSNAYALRCVGDSMTPRIRNGEFVVVEPNREVSNGDEVLVKATGGRVMVKTFLYRRDGRVHLLSVNEAHPPLAIDESEVEAMHYVAAIVKPTRWVTG